MDAPILVGRACSFEPGRNTVTIRDPEHRVLVTLWFTSREPMSALLRALVTAQNITEIEEARTDEAHGGLASALEADDA